MKGWATDLAGSDGVVVMLALLLLNGFIRAAAVGGELVVVVGGFLSIDNNSAEDNLTLEFEEDFKPVAAEAKLSI